jgi:hypothetical protein
MRMTKGNSDATRADAVVAGVTAIEAPSMLDEGGALP